MVNKFPSLLGYVKSFKITCIIVGECTVEKNAEISNETLTIFEIRKQAFCPVRKKKLCLILHLCCFGPGHNIQKNGPIFSFWRSNWIRKFIYGIFFANYKIFRLHATIHDSAGSLAVKVTTKKRPRFCFVSPSLPSLCFLGHSTGLFACI